MKKSVRLCVTAAVCLLSGAAGSCRSSVDTLGVNFTLEHRSLSNGLQVVMVEDHTIPVVTFQTWFRVGSVDEHPGITGVSHLFEHLMFKGTPKYGAKQFFEKLEAKGAEVNAFTTRDYTVYYENFTPDMLELVADMESDRLAHLKLDEEIVNTERQVVLEERRLRTDNSPAGKMQEALWQLAYHRHPYQWPVIGYPQDVLSVPLKEVVAYFNSHYQPGNATLIIVGDINPDKTFELIKKYYSEIPGRDKPKREIPVEPEQEEEHRLVIHDRVASQEFSQAYHVPAGGSDDSYALDVLANILFEGESSRAYRKLVEEKDIVVGISGSAYTPTYPGLFIVSGVMKGSLPGTDAEPLMDGVISEVQTNGVTKEEVDIAVRQLTVQLVDSVRTPYGVAQVIGTVQMVLGDADKFIEDFTKYLKVTPEDVKRVAAKYLNPNNRSIVTVVPEAAGVKTVTK